MQTCAPFMNPCFYWANWFGLMPTYHCTLSYKLVISFRVYQFLANYWLSQKSLVSSTCYMMFNFLCSWLWLWLQSYCDWSTMGKWKCPSEVKVSNILCLIYTLSSFTKYSSCWEFFNDSPANAPCIWNIYHKNCSLKSKALHILQRRLILSIALFWRETTLLWI